MTVNLNAKKVYQLIEQFRINLAEEEDLFKEFGLSSTLDALLTTIIRLDNPTTTQLAENLDITKSAVSQMTAKLEEQGFVQKAADPEDKRVQRIMLDELGLAYAKELNRYDEFVYDILSQSLDDQELKQVANSFTKILTVMNQKKYANK